MKIPITDQFILDIVSSFVGTTNNVVDFLLSNKYRQIDILFGKEHPVFKKYRRDINSIKFDQMLYHLKKTNCIKIRILENKKAIIITKKGLSKALRASFKNQEVKNRKDGKWIMIIFDIPQRYRKTRALLMSILKNLGYKLLQQSVWVTPYDVSKKTERLLQVYSLEKYVKIFLIEKV